MPAGNRAGWNAARATSFSASARSVPATLNLPSANSMSASAASSRCAAMRLPLSITFCAASVSAPPPTTIEREPFEPMPNATRSAVDELHFLRVDAEAIAEDLLEDCLVSLAVCLGAHQQDGA